MTQNKDGKAPKRPRSPSGIDVADMLREQMRKGRLVPGQRLVEIDIVHQTGASRSKVREALQRLEAERLVRIEEFRGASVRRADMEEIRQIYRARVALEGISAADFARNATPAQKRKLGELQAALDLCVAERAPERFGRLNGEWHNLVIAGSANAIVRDTLQRLSVPINRLLFESFYDEARLRAANAGHALITAAILAGDTVEAERQMRRHVEEGFATLSVVAEGFLG